MDDGVFESNRLLKVAQYFIRAEVLLPALGSCEGRLNPGFDTFRELHPVLFAAEQVIIFHFGIVFIYPCIHY
jgi:hypothetical protein